MPVSQTRHVNPTRTRFKKLILLSSLFLLLFLLFHHHHLSLSSSNTAATSPSLPSPLSLHHLLFSIATSSSLLHHRTPYLHLWHRPIAHLNHTFLFLDKPLTPPHPTHLPPTVLSNSSSLFRSGHRIARIVKEAVELNIPGIYWYIFGDDDTIFFTENLVKILSKYDHGKWYYIGYSSESYEQNEKFSFDMAYGGGGFAISAPLARVLARVLDSCLARYPHLFGSDARIFSCLAEIGVGLTREPGFHQVDIRGDIFGMLSAHPLSPIISLHHIDAVEPIFPGMTRGQALEHLFKAVQADPLRIFQQIVCYDRSNSLTVSISWGYAVQIYEGNQLLPNLLSLQGTFRPWKRGKNVQSSRYMFNMRTYPRDPCERPVVFFLESVVSDGNSLWTYYTKRDVVNCVRNRAVQGLEGIRVSSMKVDFRNEEMNTPRRHCADISPSFDETMTIQIRQCRVDELIAM